MAERIVVSVDAPADRPDLLKVQDAFTHILELFDLATHSESDAENVVVWRLVSVSMQSPLTVVSEAVSARPGVDIDQIARAQKAEFGRNYSELRQGRVPKIWSMGIARKTARSIFQRNCDGIGQTNINIDPDNKASPEIVVTPVDAEVVVQALDDATNDIAPKIKEQVGSVEGFMVQVGTHYNRPAILIRERKTGMEVWCVVPDEFRSQIAGEANFDDVWNGRRVLVHGRISYEKSGQIARIFATHIHRVDAHPVAVESITDPSFTNGLSVSEYLEKLRDGDLG